MNAISYDIPGDISHSGQARNRCVCLPAEHPVQTFRFVAIWPTDICNRCFYTVPTAVPSVPQPVAEVCDWTETWLPSASCDRHFGILDWARWFWLGVKGNRYCLATKSPPFTRSLPLLRSLHWLPVRFKILFLRYQFVDLQNPAWKAACLSSLYACGINPFPFTEIKQQ